MHTCHVVFPEIWMRMIQDYEFIIDLDFLLIPMLTSFTGMGTMLLENWQDFSLVLTTHWLYMSSGSLERGKNFKDTLLFQEQLGWDICSDLALSGISNGFSKIMTIYWNFAQFQLIFCQNRLFLLPVFCVLAIDKWQGRPRFKSFIQKRPAFFSCLTISYIIY